MQGSTVVIQLNFCAKNPHLRQAQKRTYVVGKRNGRHRKQETDRQKNEILTLKAIRNKVTDDKKNI